MTGGTVMNTPSRRTSRSLNILFAAIVLSLTIAVSPSLAGSAAAAPALSFTVSMERPASHYYHVVLRAAGLKGATQDLKMPVWTPGYYRIMDYAKAVKDFRVVDGTGKALPFEKTAKNTWRVRTGKAAAFVASYDVYAFTRFVADSYLGDDGGFITPAGLFMSVAGHLKDPVTVTVVPFSEWRQVSTGLDPMPGRANTFRA